MPVTTKADEKRWQIQLEKAQSFLLSLDELETFKQELRNAGKFQESMKVGDLMIEKLKQEIMIEKLEQKIRKLEYAAAKTIGTIYYESGERTFPTLELNPEVVPSIEGHHLKDMEPQRAVYTKTTSARTMWNKLLPNVVVPTETEKEDKSTRFITSQFDPQVYPLRYANEIDIQIYVNCLVKDAIACMGCNRILGTRMEISMYGVKPDIIVVEQGLKVVFVIEVKSPNREGNRDKVCENALVGGQIWLYLMAMRQHGVIRPLGAICTFNQIRLVSLQDMANHPFTEASDKLKNTVATPWVVKKRIESKEQPSPDPKRKCVSEVSKKFEFEHPADAFADGKVNKVKGGGKVFKAQLYGSSIANNQDVLPLLLLGLTTAKIDIDKQMKQPASIAEAGMGADLGSRQFAYATEKTLGFALTPKRLQVIAGHPSHRCKIFYLLDTIGAGHTGGVYLAVSTTGVCGAIKFYHMKPSREATPMDRKVEDEISITETTVERDKELKRWNELYPSRKARAIKLRGLPCLLMEYGTRIPKEERKEYLDDIRKEMTRFFEFRNKETKFGYAYKETELCWRHVLKDRDGKIFLADLGSLEKLERADTSEVVDNQITYLAQEFHVACDDEAKKKGESKPSSKKRVRS